MRFQVQGFMRQAAAGVMRPPGRAIGNAAGGKSFFGLFRFGFGLFL
jgi:hypothetical protein